MKTLSRIRSALILLLGITLASPAFANPLVYLCGSYSETTQTLILENPSKTPILIAKTNEFKTENSGCFIGSQLPGRLADKQVFVAHAFNSRSPLILAPVGICGQLTHPSEGETWLWLYIGASFQLIPEEGAGFSSSDLYNLEPNDDFCAEGSSLPLEGSPFLIKNSQRTGSKSGVSIGNQ